LLKKRVIEEIVCDFCEQKATGKCDLCGRDICIECTRWICKKRYSPTSGGLVLYPGLNYDSYPWKWEAERALCKDCVEKFKMSLVVLASKGGRRDS